MDTKHLRNIKSCLELLNKGVKKLLDFVNRLNRILNKRYSPVRRLPYSNLEDPYTPHPLMTFPCVK